MRFPLYYLENSNRPRISYIMEWERKFSSIVKETETNLEKVKKRLGSARASSNLALILNNSGSDSLNGDTYPFSANRSTYRDGMSALGTQFASSSMYKSSLLNGDGRHLSTPSHDSALHTASGYDQNLTLESSHGVAMLLQEKIAAQAKAIESLTRTVQRLSEEKDLYYKQMKSLREELAALNQRVSEKGVDLQTERKLERWRSDMMSEVQLLQQQIQLHRSRDESHAFHDSQALSLIREIQDLKRFVQDDCNNLRRDMHAVKNRVVKAEMDVGSMLRDIQGLGRQNDCLTQSVRDLSDLQQSTNDSLSKSQRERELANMEMSQLKERVEGLKDRADHRIMAVPVRRRMLPIPATIGTALTSNNSSYKQSAGVAMVKTAEVTGYPASKGHSGSPHDSDLDLFTDLELHSPDLLLTKMGKDEELLDTEEEFDLLDSAELSLTSDGLSTDGDTLDLDELK